MPEERARGSSRFKFSGMPLWMPLQVERAAMENTVTEERAEISARVNWDAAITSRAGLIITPPPSPDRLPTSVAPKATIKQIMEISISAVGDRALVSAWQSDSDRLIRRR